MGLLDVFKRKSKDKSQEEAMALHWVQYEELWVTLTSNNLKVKKFDENGRQYIKGGYVWEEDNLLQAKVGNRIIFEMTPRSKSYPELKEWRHKKLHDILIVSMEGEYGVYYRARLRYKAGERDEMLGK